MSSIPCPSRVALLLCGGAGTRLRSVTDRPKSVLEVAGWPFLRYHLEALRDAAMDRIVFLVGYGADEVERIFGPPSQERIFAREQVPLGTGGALASARVWAGESNWIVNGDSFADVPPRGVLAAHQQGRGTIVTVPLEDVSDYGCVETRPDGTILSFSEKGRQGPGRISVGAYVLDRSFLNELPEGASSLERDAFPSWAREGRLRAFHVEAFFRDIGTPERLEAAQREFIPIRRRFEGLR